MAGEERRRFLKQVLLGTGAAAGAGAGVLGSETVRRIDLTRDKTRRDKFLNLDPYIGLQDPIEATPLAHEVVLAAQNHFNKIRGDESGLAPITVSVIRREILAEQFVDIPGTPAHPDFLGYALFSIHPPTRLSELLFQPADPNDDIFNDSQATQAAHAARYLQGNPLLPENFHEAYQQRPALPDLTERLFALRRVLLQELRPHDQSLRFQNVPDFTGGTGFEDTLTELYWNFFYIELPSPDGKQALLLIPEAAITELSSFDGRLFFPQIEAILGADVLRIEGISEAVGRMLAVHIIEADLTPFERGSHFEIPESLVWPGGKYKPGKRHTRRTAPELVLIRPENRRQSPQDIASYNLPIRRRVGKVIAKADLVSVSLSIK